ncbi:MAG: DUF3150 domain-containing protein [Halothiobacillaceae bacterium]
MEERIVNVLDQIVCIRLDVTIWSGQKKLTAEDLGLSPEQIPPEELAALGRKRICDPKDLAEFSKLKKRGVRLLAQHGVRFLDGYAVPADKMSEINAQLDDLGREFQEAKAEFLANYENSVEDWIARHSEWEAQIRRAVETPERVAATLQWRRACYRVVHPGQGEDTGLTMAVSGLGGQLLREVAQEAKETYEESFKDKAEVTRRALRPLVRIYEKLRGLSFLEPKVKPFLDLMAEVISEADNQSGLIAGQALHELQSLLRLLMRPDDLLAGAYTVLFRKGRAKAATLQPLAIDLELEEEPAQAAEPESPASAVGLPEQSPAWFY